MPAFNPKYTLFTISIHAPRGGSDITVYPLVSPAAVFQSTLPVGGATTNRYICDNIYVHFNPRSPWGERLASPPSIYNPFIISIHAPRGGSDFLSQVSSVFTLSFQSTLPVGGATAWLFRRSVIWKISIHAPRGGSDSPPTLSDGWIRISIHAPRGGSDDL